METLQQRIQRFECGITPAAKLLRGRARFMGAMTSWALTGVFAHRAFNSAYDYIRNSQWEIADTVGELGYKVTQTALPIACTAAALALGYALHKGIRQCIDGTFPPSIPAQQGWEQFHNFEQYRRLVSHAPQVIDSDIIILSPLPRDAYLAEFYTAVDELTLRAGQRDMQASIILEDQVWYIPRSTLGGDREEVDDGKVTPIRPIITQYTPPEKKTIRSA